MVAIHSKSFLAGADQFLSQQNVELIDQTVFEVFGMMLGFAVTPVEQQSLSGDPEDQPERTAIVGFSGTLRGSCGIRLSRVSARAVATAMLGGPVSEKDSESVDDAVGELCNMLAGGWKGRTPSLDSHCLLSPPAVISGSDYRIHIRSASASLTRTYRFEQHTLQVTMVRDQQANA